jgi:hypothetical protein
MSHSFTRRKYVLGLICLPLLASACHFQVMQREPEPPSPLQGFKDIGVRFDYKGTSVGGMDLESFLAKRVSEDAAYAKTWDDFTASFEDNFMNGLQTNWGSVVLLKPDEKAPDTTAELVVGVSTIEMGKYIPMFTSKTEVVLALRWLAKGTVAFVDRAIRDQTPTITTPSVFQHIKPIGRELGSDAAFLMRKHVK